jgi:hypothetical protein
MKKVQYYVFKEQGGDNTIDVIVEDGGVATAYNPDDHYRTDYYQNRIDETTTVDNLWDELSKGKMHSNDWEGKEPTEQELIDDMLEWLYCSTEAVEFVRNDMGEMTEEIFNEIKSKLDV